MNHPTREEFNALAEKVHRLEQQQTEPMRVTRIEVEQKDLVLTLEKHTAMLQMLSEQSDRHTVAFQQIQVLIAAQTEVISALQAEMISMRATQSDHGELLREILARLPEKGA